MKHWSMHRPGLLPVSLLVNEKRELGQLKNGREAEEEKGRGKESETCGLRVPKTRFGIHLLKFDWLFR